MKYLSLALLLAAPFACKSKSESAPAPSTPGSASASLAGSASATPAPAVTANPTSSAGLPESDVKAFVTRWEAAQNAHDFAAYSALYADRFMGVKRVGTYSKRFDRTSWLADRKPMFEGGAKVRVTDVTLVAAAGATRAVFTQEFTSTGFRDIGKKELFLVPAPSGIAISREEMLSSQVNEEAASSEAVLAFHRHGVVLQRSFDKAKVTGAPRLLSPPNASPIQVAFDVSAEALSSATRGWLGKGVTVYTATGESCSGKVTGFEVRVQAVPHFGMRQSWNGEREEPKATPAAIAQSIARMAQNEEHFVVGVLDRACDGSWASGTAPSFVRAAPAPAALRAAGIAAFKGLPGYADLQKKFIKDAGEGNKPWETANGELSVVELRAPSRPAVLLVAARSGGGCAGFNGSLSAFWNVAGTAEAPKLQALAPSLNEFVTLRGALDQGADQGLALLAGPDNFDDQLAVLRLAPKVTRRVVFSTSFWDCDC